MIEDRLEDLRRDLLDLTRRNRLLNLRPGSARDLPLLDVDPDQVLVRLVEEGRQLSFLSREEGEVPAAAQTGDGFDPLAGELPDSVDHEAFRLAPLDHDGRGAGPDRLATGFPGERLQTRLLTLEREARSAFEEHGTNLLHLSLGSVLWTEGEDGPSCRAPLLFVPVELSRSSVKSRHRIHLFDAELETNPCLRELATRRFGVELPVYDPERHESASAFFAEVEQRLEGLGGWTLTPDCCLGLFSFAKLLMYEDLDPGRHGERLAGHPVLRRLCGEPIDEEEAADLAGALPDPRCFDRRPVTGSFEVLDADSSQQAAIEAVKAGASMVLEGPPGTGKSQTITNVIAECLAEGKSVLFVSEKAAALDVVRRRLDGVGLGCFALELHSRRASKRAVLAEIRRSLESREDFDRDPELGAEALEDLRARLAGYVEDLWRPIGSLGMTAFEAMSQAIRLADVREAPFSLPDVLALEPQQLLEARNRIRRLDQRLARAEPLERHPWHGARLVEARLDLRQALRRELPAFEAALARLREATARLGRLLGGRVPHRVGEVQDQQALAGFVATRPRLDPGLVRDPRWDDPDPVLDAWLAAGREREELRQVWSPHLRPEAEDVEVEGLAERHDRRSGSPLRFLSPGWWRDRSLLRRLATGGIDEARRALPALCRSRELRAQLVAGEAACAPRFGTWYRGLDQGFGVLSARCMTLRRMRRELGAGSVGETEILAWLGQEPDQRGELDEARARAADCLAEVEDCFDTLCRRIDTDSRAWLGALWGEADLEHLALRLSGLGDRLEELADQANLQASIRECADPVTEGFLAWAMGDEGMAARGNLERCFLRQVHRLFVDAALDELPALREFRGVEHEDAIARFRELDRRWITVNRQRLRRRIQDQWPQMAHAAHRHGKLGMLQAELGKKRRQMSLRRLFATLGDLVQRIQPCFLMSPISVAQFLEPGRISFDLVVFDEASQVEPADAYGAISRGDQLLLVGDEKQLPPTAFFTRSETEERGDDGEDFHERDLESILSLAKARLPLRARLRWHYRSRHESLVDFSNSRFYDHELRVFPSPVRDRRLLGLEFHHVRDAVYLRGRGQYNPIEAQEIAARVIEHAVATPGLSLGVGAFSVQQQRAIEDEIERFRRESDDPRVEAFFGRHEAEPFFVKNLETIQGDERDVILLSVGYGRDEHGRLSMNFGPLNQEGGWRRLNVLITRARRKCEVFSSIRSEDIDLARTQAEGVRALKDYLYFAEHGLLPDIGAPRQDHDSPFEAEVCRALREHGFEVQAQVGAAGFSIDLALVDPRAPGRYLCGIECDGATYHGSPTARDRDRLRQEVLEGLGWRILRVWSTDWFHRPRTTLERLLGQVRALLEAPLPRDGEVVYGAGEAGFGDEVGTEDLAVVTPADGSDRTVVTPAAGSDRTCEGDSAGSDGEAPFQADRTETGEAAEPIAADAVEPVDGIAVEQLGGDGDGLVPGPEPYRRAVLRRQGDMDAMERARPEELGALIVEVVEVEGPVHVDRVLRLVAASYGARATKRPRELFQRGMLWAQSEGMITGRGNFLWPRGRQRARVRFRGDDCPVTETELIAPEELREAVLAVLELEVGLPPEHLVESVRRWLGFRRSGRRIQVAIERALDELLEEGRARLEEGFLKTVEGA